MYSPYGNDAARENVGIGEVKIKLHDSTDEHLHPLSILAIVYPGSFLSFAGKLFSS